MMNGRTAGRISIILAVAVAMTAAGAAILDLMALFRARRDESVQGVLRTAAAFNALGNRDVAAHAMQIAATLDHHPRIANTTPATSF